MSNLEFKIEPQNIDRLTGLPNFSLLLDYFNRSIETKKYFGVILLDIDRFILFNHYYGHQ
jgi:GGDEF domain-containing protein